MPNDRARDSGIQPGMRLTDALAILPKLATQHETPQADAAVLRALADWCQRYTPTVSLDGTNGLWLDITGAAHLCGGEDELLADLSHRLQAIGFASKLGLAETPGAAWAIARFSDASCRNVPPGSLVRSLASLPVAALRLDEDALYLIKRFGLKDIGALCAIPRASLKRRFPSKEAPSKEAGEAVLHRLDQALGQIREPIVPLRPAPAYLERLSFAEPILATEGFERGLDDLLDRLCCRLEAAHRGALHVTFSAYHADGGVSWVAIGAAQPSHDADHLRHLFRDRIATLNPGFGVDHLTLSADKVQPLKKKQQPLFQAAALGQRQNDIARLVDRLSNRLGADNVYRIVPQASHIPEQAEQRSAPMQAGDKQPAAKPHKPLRPFRLLPRPEPITVIAEVPEGPPRRLTWRRVTHRIIHAEGPERIAPEWWHLTSSRTMQTRDYYRIEDEDGRRFWIFRAGLYRDLEQDEAQPLPSWHMHGLFA